MDKFGMNEETKKNASKTQTKKKNSKSSKIEAVKVTIEKKKQCNSKALEIVANLSETTVDEEFLIKILPFIDQEHYQDIVEERAINKLCGYSLCLNKLKNIPSKQYHISTVHNKVFDITDRKNFCSNLCYKASKYLKDQILTSPIWLRDSTPSEYRFLSLHSKGGSAGDEIDFGIACIKVDKDITPAPGTKNITENYSHDCCDSPLPNADVTEDILSSNLEETGCGNNARLNELSLERFSKESCEESSNHLTDTNLEEDCKLRGPGSKTDEKLTKDPKNPDQNPAFLSNLENQKQNDIAPNLSTKKAFDDSLSASTRVGPSESTVTFKLAVPGNCHKGIDEKSGSIVTENSEPKLSTSESRNPCSKQKIKKTSKKVNVSSLQNSITKIEQILKEWFTLDSLFFLFSEEKVKEIFAEKTDQIKKNPSLKGSSVMDAHIYERYLEVCKKLNILELEDTKADALFREDIKKPLPCYEELKKESEELELKVKRFYKGDKIVQFEESQSDATSKEGTLLQEPVMPLVDLHAQKALRRRIVLDKLRRILQDLQQTLGLRGFNLNQEVRLLVTTFHLSAHNVTMKPAEWNLVSIVIIKLLSLKDKCLQQSLNTEFTVKHLTLLLMSYSLDGGYLDRLICWLTDIDSLLQKT